MKIFQIYSTFKNAVFKTSTLLLICDISNYPVEGHKIYQLIDDV